MGEIRWMGFRGGVFVGWSRDVFELYTIISLSTFSHSSKGVGNKKSDSYESLFLFMNESIIHYDLSSL